MYTTEFWKATFERALATIAQTALGVWAASEVTGLDQIDLAATLSAAGFAGLASVLKGVIAATTGGTPGPGFGDAETTVRDDQG